MVMGAEEVYTSITGAKCSSLDCYESSQSSDKTITIMQYRTMNINLSLFLVMTLLHSNSRRSCFKKRKCVHELIELTTGVSLQCGHMRDWSWLCE
jgi:hypothetical protein